MLSEMIAVILALFVFSTAVGICAFVKQNLFAFKFYNNSSSSYFKASIMILAFGIQWNKSISKKTPFFVRNQNRVQFHRFKLFLSRIVFVSILQPMTVSVF